MALQFLVGFVVSVINIMIHALVTVGAVGVARSAGLRYREWPRLHLMLVMVGTAAALMVAHTLEVFVWALAYSLVGAAPAPAGFGPAFSVRPAMPTQFTFRSSPPSWCGP